MQLLFMGLVFRDVTLAKGHSSFVVVVLRDQNSEKNIWCLSDLDRSQICNKVIKTWI